MKTLKTFLAMAIIAILSSCSKSDDATQPNPANAVYRVKEILNANNVVLNSFSYNTQGKITKRVFADGTFFNFGYNSQGLLSTNERAGSPNTNDNWIINYTYDASGAKTLQIQTYSNGNKTKLEYTNNSIGLPTGYKYFGWTVANPTWVENLSGNVSFTYNSKNEITKAQAQNFYTLKVFDDRGNTIDIKQFNKKADGTYYLVLENIVTFDDKKRNITEVDEKKGNNSLTVSAKTLNEAGVIQSQSSAYFTYEYNEAGYVTKQFKGGNLELIYVLEKI